ncbi:hypothetical protein [Mechercharimyces sp. CAU 1602]|uniref:hypothetical protein n=1 Tax=Mechercharimyces sp. CAU 1602 TaxID=2973933 RepID=UPI002161A6C6|nr:hypothetical protein [Mechercharimyces sp. CAU 1602]MCS1350196.1 hypothetical protein [Mechercharimyces sp. CAU 1602]
MPFKKDDPMMADQIEEMRVLSQEISKATSDVERMMKAMTNISFAMKDPKIRQDLFTLLSGMQGDGGDIKTAASRPSKEKKQTSSFNPNEFELPDDLEEEDSFFNILNSPSFAQFVHSVLNKKNKSEK